MTPVRSRVETQVMDDAVALECPAQGVYVVVLRSAMASLATRCDLSLDEVYNLRTAVDEAALILLGRSAPDATLRCELSVVDGSIRARVQAAVTDTSPPDQATLSWMVVEGLMASLGAHADGDVMTVEFSYPVGGPAGT